MGTIQSGLLKNCTQAISDCMVFDGYIHHTITSLLLSLKCKKNFSIIFSNITLWNI